MPESRASASYRELSDAGAGQHVDERFDAEQLDLPADQVAYPRLLYSEEFGGGVLRELACLDKPFEFRHQLRAQAQALRLFWFEPEVSKYVPRRALDFHCLLLILSGGAPLQQLPQSRSG
jgi:hypothetical protein